MARHNVDVTNIEEIGDFARQPKFFIGHPAGGDDRHVSAAELSELERRLRDRVLPIARHEFSSVGNLRLEQPTLRFEILEIEPAVIAHPAGVDVIVLARRLPINDVLARADERVAPGRAARADAFSLLQKPNPHFETEIGGGERADRAKIHRVK